MSTRATHSDDIDLASLIGALRRRLPGILILSVLAGALTYAALSMMASRYTSEAQIAIASKRTNPFPDQERQVASAESVTSRLDREAINTYVKALSAPTLLLRVAEELDLASNREFNSALGPVDAFDSLMRSTGFGGGHNPDISDTDRVLESVKSRLEVSAARESRFITIRFTATDPELSAAFANALARTYKQSLIDVPVQETTDVVKALMPKIEQLNKEVGAAETELQSFRARTDRLLTGPQLVPLNSQRLSALSDELVRAESERSQAEARWSTARDMSRVGSADVLPEVQQSIVIQGLIAQRVRLERQVSEAAATLLPAHPRMRQLNADLAGLKRSIESEVGKVVQSLEKGYRSAQLRVEDIRRQIDSLKTKVVDTSADDAQVKVLEAAAKSKRAELDRLQRQLEDNRTLVVTRTVPVEAQIVSEARASGVPTFPKKGPISALVAAAMFLLALAFAAAREIVVRSTTPAGNAQDAALRRAEELAIDWRSAPEAPVPAARAAPAAPRHHAVLPEPAEAPAASKAASVAAVAQAGMSAAKSASGSLLARALKRGATDAVPEPEAAQAPSVPARKPVDAAGSPQAGLELKLLASEILSLAQAGVGFRTMIVGEIARIDPSEQALQLCDELAAQGRRVLLVDVARDGKGFAARLHLSPVPGFTDVLAGTAGFEDVICNLPGSSLHVIACGSSGYSGSDPDDVNMILDALDEAYDHIVVCARYDDARDLFEMVQGRFDAGVSVGEGPSLGSGLHTNDTTFLGFEVTEIAVRRIDRTGGAAGRKGGPRRLAGGPAGSGLAREPQLT